MSEKNSNSIDIRKLHDENVRDLSILIIDDDPLILKTISRILMSSNSRYFIETAENIEDAYEFIHKTYWDTILLDLSIPNKKGEDPDTKNGLRVLDELRNEFKISAPIVAMTGFDDDTLSDIVLDKGAYYFLNKPLKPKSLSAIVKNATGFKMSGFDGLTGLLNRMTFEERLKSEFERSKRKNEELDIYKNDMEYQTMNRSYLSLIFLDGDNFKLINDTFNHLIGDQVLKKIGNSFIDDNLYKPINNGKAFRYIIRPYDIASRFGGDEFSIFLPETDHQSAVIVAKRIRNLFREYDISDIIKNENIPSSAIKISLSIGIATYPSPNIIGNYKELINLADEAMYASKEKREGEIFGYNSAGILSRFD